MDDKIELDWRVPISWFMLGLWIGLIVGAVLGELGR